ncbi:MAG: PadR family transcriptional regulator [Gemmatimonadota bacterium]
MTAQRTRTGLTPLTYQILLALSAGERHGYAILKEMEDRGGAEAVPSTGALYMAISRLEDEGLVEAARAPAEEADSRRRYYRITRNGRAVAAAESQRLADLLADARARHLLPGAVTEGAEP